MRADGATLARGVWRYTHAGRDPRLGVGWRRHEAPKPPASDPAFVEAPITFALLTDAGRER